MVASLLKSEVSIGEPDAKHLQQIIEKFPENVPLDGHCSSIYRNRQMARVERLRKLERLLTASRDIGRGRRIFFGEVGAIRSGHETYSGVQGENTADAVTLVTGPKAEVRIPRKQVVSMKP